MDSILGYFACKNEVYARYTKGAVRLVLRAATQEEAIQYAEYCRTTLD